MIFSSPSHSLCVLLMRSEFIVTIVRSQHDSSHRHLHRRHQKYQKEMLIKILLREVEVTHLSCLNFFVVGCVGVQYI